MVQLVRRKITHLLIVLTLVSLSSNTPVQAEAIGVTILPESHHQQYSTFGLFIDGQSTLIYRTISRAWAGLGIGVPLLGFGPSELQPQLILTGNVNTALRLESGGEFNSETADSRQGLTFEYPLHPDLRFSIGLVHASGHASDNVLELDLIPYDLGQDSMPMRVVYDYSGPDPRLKHAQFKGFMSQFWYAGLMFEI